MVNSIDYVLRFLKKLCRSLHCENLFSDQPISQRASYHSDGKTLNPTPRLRPCYITDRCGLCSIIFHSPFFPASISPVVETSLAEDYRHEQADGKRYPVAEHRESAFNSISSSSYSSSPKSSYGFRASQQFSNAPVASRPSPSSPGAFVESNRTGEAIGGLVASQLGFSKNKHFFK